MSAIRNCTTRRGGIRKAGARAGASTPGDVCANNSGKAGAGVNVVDRGAETKRAIDQAGGAAGRGRASSHVFFCADFAAVPQVFPMTIFWEN
jgi:hypothetical protein